MVSRVDGTLVHLCALIGVPSIRLRAAVPESLLPGTLEEAIGRAGGLSATAIRMAAGHRSCPAALADAGADAEKGFRNGKFATWVPRGGPSSPPYTRRGTLPMAGLAERSAGPGRVATWRAGRGSFAHGARAKPIVPLSRAGGGGSCRAVADKCSSSASSSTGAGAESIRRRGSSPLSMHATPEEASPSATPTTAAEETALVVWGPGSAADTATDTPTSTTDAGAREAAATPDSPPSAEHSRVGRLPSTSLADDLQARRRSSGGGAGGGTSSFRGRLPSGVPGARGRGRGRSRSREKRYASPTGIFGTAPAEGLSVVASRRMRPGAIAQPLQPPPPGRTRSATTILKPGRTLTGIPARAVIHEEEEAVGLRQGARSHSAEEGRVAATAHAARQRQQLRGWSSPKAGLGPNWSSFTSLAQDPRRFSAESSVPSVPSALGSSGALAGPSERSTTASRRGSSVSGGAGAGAEGTAQRGRMQRDRTVLKKAASRLGSTKSAFDAFASSLQAHPLQPARVWLATSSERGPLQAVSAAASAALGQHSVEVDQSTVVGARACCIPLGKWRDFLSVLPNRSSLPF